MQVVPGLYMDICDYINQIRRDNFARERIAPMISVMHHHFKMRRCIDIVGEKLYASDKKIGTIEDTTVGQTTMYKLMCLESYRRSHSLDLPDDDYADRTTWFGRTMSTGRLGSQYNTRYQDLYALMVADM